MLNACQIKFLKLKRLKSFLDILKLMVLVNLYTSIRTVFDTPYLLTSYSTKESWKFTVSFSEGSCYFHLSFHFSSKRKIPTYREFWGKEEIQLLSCFFSLQHERQYVLFFSFISRGWSAFSIAQFLQFLQYYTLLFCLTIPLWLLNKLQQDANLVLLHKLTFSKLLTQKTKLLLSQIHHCSL